MKFNCPPLIKGVKHSHLSSPRRRLCDTVLLGAHSLLFYTVVPVCPHYRTSSTVLITYWTEGGV